MSWIYTAFGSSDFVCFNHRSKELGLVLTNGLACFWHFRGHAPEKFHHSQCTGSKLDRFLAQVHDTNLTSSLEAPFSVAI